MNYMRNQKGKKIGLHMLTAALFFVLAMSVCTVKTEAKDYKQGKVYKITAKSKPLKASKFTKNSLKKTKLTGAMYSKFLRQTKFLKKASCIRLFIVLLLAFKVKTCRLCW